MAYPYTRKQLDDTQPLYAVRAFQWDGNVALQVGEVFEVEKLGVRRDQLSTLWSQRYIDHERPAIGQAAPAVQASPKPASSPAQESRKRQGARQ